MIRSFEPSTTPSLTDFEGRTSLTGASRTAAHATCLFSFHLISNSGSWRCNDRRGHFSPHRVGAPCGSAQIPTTEWRIDLPSGVLPDHYPNYLIYHIRDGGTKAFWSALLTDSEPPESRVSYGAPRSCLSEQGHSHLSVLFELSPALATTKAVEHPSNDLNVP